MTTFIKYFGSLSVLVKFVLAVTVKAFTQEEQETWCSVVMEEHRSGWRRIRTANACMAAEQFLMILKT